MRCLLMDIGHQYFQYHLKYVSKNQVFSVGHIYNLVFLLFNQILPDLNRNSIYAMLWVLPINQMYQITDILKLLLPSIYSDGFLINK